MERDEQKKHKRWWKCSCQQSHIFLSLLFSAKTLLNFSGHFLKWIKFYFSSHFFVCVKALILLLCILSLVYFSCLTELNKRISVVIWKKIFFFCVWIECCRKKVFCVNCLFWINWDIKLWTGLLRLADNFRLKGKHLGFVLN